MMRGFHTGGHEYLRDANYNINQYHVAYSTLALTIIVGLYFIVDGGKYVAYDRERVKSILVRKQERREVGDIHLKSQRLKDNEGNWSESYYVALRFSLYTFSTLPHLSFFFFFPLHPARKLQVATLPHCMFRSFGCTQVLMH